MSIESDMVERANRAAFKKQIPISATKRKMTRTVSKIHFSATLFRPSATAKVGSWTFVTLLKNASAKLPSRGMTAVEGTINGFPFRATLEPDGQRSHWLKVNRKMREAAGADPGDVVTLEIAPAGVEPELKTPRRPMRTLRRRSRSHWAGVFTESNGRQITDDEIQQAAKAFSN